MMEISIALFVILLVVLLLVGFVVGFLVMRAIVTKQLRENPPVNKDMIRAMYMQMGRKPTERDVNRVMESMNKYSTNPYNVNRMTAGAGLGAILDAKYFNDNCKRIIENRKYTAKSLKELGFSLTNSSTNFVFAKTDKIGGEQLYLKLKEKGILVRHFGAERIKDYIRITIGSLTQMERFIDCIREILEEI